MWGPSDRREAKAWSGPLRRWSDGEFHVGRLGAEIWKVRLIKLGFQIGSFLDKRPRNRRVADRFRQLEKRCRPPREIVSASHDAFPLIPRLHDVQTKGIVPRKLYKNALRDLVPLSSNTPPGDTALFQMFLLGLRRSNFFNPLLVGWVNYTRFGSPCVDQGGNV
jgi:hypothetical protein